MNSRTKLFFTVALAAMITVLSVDTAVYAKTDAKTVEDEKAEWTVLAYICGTDLETDGACATANLEEIAATTPGDSVNVVIQTGGTREWHSKDLGIDINPKRTTRLNYDSKGFHMIQELPLQNMASGDTLSDFISWGAENFPAEKYLLVMWDHGGGAEVGAIVDEYHGDAIMTLSDLERAVNTADVDLEAVLFDCCLMASLEVADCLQDNADYLIASEEIMAGLGTAWERWLQYLYDAPSCDGGELGTAICDTIQQKYIDLGDDMSSTIMTMSVVDLSKTDNVREKFDAFFTKLCEVVQDPKLYREYLLRTRLAESYFADESGMVDLADLADKAKKSGVINDEAMELYRAVTDAVVYSVKGQGRGYSHGLSYYDGTGSTARELDHYARAAKSAPYLAYLDAVRMNWTAPDWVYDETDHVANITYTDYGVDTELSIADDGDLELSVIDGLGALIAIDYVLYTEDEDGEFIELGTGTDIADVDEEKGIFSAGFDGKWPAIDGTFCSMMIDDENEAYTRYYTPVVIEEVDESKYRGGDAVEDITGRLYYLCSAYINAKDDGSGNAFEVYGFSKPSGVIENTAFPDRGTFTLADFEGLKLRVMLPSKDPYTGAETLKKGDLFTLTRDVSIEKKTLPEGNYGYSFLISDMMGNVMETDIAKLYWDGEKAVYTLPGEEEDELEVSQDDADTDVSEVTEEKTETDTDTDTTEETEDKTEDKKEDKTEDKTGSDVKNEDTGSEKEDVQKEEAEVSDYSDCGVKITIPAEFNDALGVIEDDEGEVGYGSDIYMV
ncbi:MAG: hypothetical protein K6G22_11550, partial [Lachnospiraceae bacterium]|nr:hypothetical protein [Lachnospiraceae bacterium]